MTCNVLLKVNNIAGDKGKKVICRVFAEAEIMFPYMYAEFCIIKLRIFSSDFWHISLIQFAFSVR